MNNILENKILVMNKTQAVILAMMLGLMSIFTTISEAKRMNEKQTLSDRQKSIVTIAAFTASGDLKELKTSLNEGLESGLTVNEIKEILVQMYAYAGFPRSLNGITTFMEVLEKRRAKGIEDETGKEAGAVPADFDKDEYGAKVRATLAGRDDIPPPSGWQLFVPVIDTFLKEHLFADIFVRDVLSHQDRELATIAALANMTGTGGQLGFHFGAAMNTGLTETQMKEFISTLNDKIDKKKAENAEEVLNTVLNSRE